MEPSAALDFSEKWQKSKNGLRHPTELLEFLLCMKDARSISTGFSQFKALSLEPKQPVKERKEVPKDVKPIASVFNDYYAPLLEPSEFTFVSEDDLVRDLLFVFQGKFG